MDSDVRREPRAVTGIRLVVEVICGLLLFAIMLYTVGNVISRTIVGTPLPAVIELITRWWMVPLVFGGWLVAHLAGEHIRVDFIVEKTSGIVTPFYQVANKVLLAVFLVLVTYGGWIGATENRLRAEHGIDTNAPVWTTRYAVPVMAALFFAFLVYEIVKILATAQRAEHLGSADHRNDTRTVADHDDA